MMTMKNSMMLTKKSRKMLEKTKFALIWFQNKISPSISWRSVEDKILLWAITKIFLTKFLKRSLITIILHSQHKMINKIIIKKIKIKKLFNKKTVIKMELIRFNKIEFKKNIKRKKKLSICLYKSSPFLEKNPLNRTLILKIKMRKKNRQPIQIIIS